MAITTNDKNLGHATAYAYAKSKGYTGTEEEFAELMASYATVAESAEESRQAAEIAQGKAEDAQAAAETAQGVAEQAKDTAVNSKDTAVSAASTATTKAGEASDSATSASESATAAAGSASSAAGSASAASESEATATTKAGEASNSATAAATAQTAAEDAQEAAETAAQTAQEYAEELKPNDKADVITNTASGAIASFSDGAAMPVKDLTVNIDPVQDLHGQDAPYPPKGSVNILPNSVASTKTVNGLTVQTMGDGVYHVSGTASARGIMIFDLVESCVIPIAIGSGGNGCMYLNNTFYENGLEIAFLNGNSTIDYWGLNSLNRSNSSYTVMGGATVNRIRFTFPAGSFNGSFAPMFSDNGSTTEPFVPYSNICPITGWDEVKVTRTGKNLFAMSDGTYAIGTTRQLIISNGVTTYKTNTSATSSIFMTEDLISAVMPNRLLKAGTYTFNVYTDAVNEAERRSLTLNFSNGTAVVNRNTFTLTEDAEIVSITTPSAASYSAGTYYCNIQIELGSASTDHEPYNGQTVTIQLGQTVYGGTLDVLTGVLIVDKGLVTLNGASDESWTRAESYHGYYHNHPDMRVGTRQSGASNWLKIVDGLNERGIWLGVNNRIIYANYVDDLLTGTTVDDWKAYLSANPLQVLYPLATPLNIQLTAEQLSTIKGTNNIFADSGDVSVEYGADTKLYIDNAIATAIAAL